MQIMFIGRVVKINPAKTFKNGGMSRQFWCDELNRTASKCDKYPNRLPFEILTSPNGGNHNYAQCPDLDELTPGNIVRFSFEPRGNVWTNPKNHEEIMFLRLQVMSKIERLTPKQESVKRFHEFYAQNPTQPNDESRPEAHDAAQDPDAVPF